MAARSRLIHTYIHTYISLTLPFYLVKLKISQKQKAYSVRFTTDGMRLFIVQQN